MTKFFDWQSTLRITFVSQAIQDSLTMNITKEVRFQSLKTPMIRISVNKASIRLSCPSSIMI